MGLSALSLSTVSYAYPARPAIYEVALAVAEGEFLGVMGPNSSGKSTLLKLMSRELRPSHGEVEVRGRPLAEWPLRHLARTITVVSSEEHFVFPFSVEQIVLMGRAPYIARGHRETAEDWVIAERAMQATDVLGLRKRSVHELSSGERQRVLLARALTQETKILILDEPTAHLDIGHAWTFFELLKKLHEQKKLTIVCALHDLTLASTFCSRVLMLRDGRIHSQGTPAEVLTESALRDVFGVSLPVQVPGFHPAPVIFKVE